MSPISGADSSCVGAGAAAPPGSKVRESPEAGGPSPGGPVPPRRPGSEPGRFARVLRGDASDSDGADGGGGAAAVAALTSWFRAEGSASSLAEGRPSAAKVTAASVAPRVLMGGGTAGAEARIQVDGGPWAGSEIRLRATATGVVEAELLTPTVSSRQTLALAMEEVGHRLRAKGVVLRGVATGHEHDQHRDRRGSAGDPESRSPDGNR